MKPHHAILIGFAIGITALVAICLCKPCPPIPEPTTTQGMLDRESQRDSIEIASAARSRILDSINAITPNQRHERSLRIARSLGRGPQLDTLLAEPR